MSNNEIETESESKRGKQVERYWTHPTDDNTHIDRDAGNWILTIANKSTFHISRVSAFEYMMEQLFIKELKNISDEDKKSITKLAEYERDFKMKLLGMFK